MSRNKKTNSPNNLSLGMKEDVQGTRAKEGLSFGIGFLFSLVAHLLCAVGFVVFMEQSAANAVRAPEVFTVTLEGGEVLGGISQVPEKNAKKKQPRAIPVAEDNAADDSTAEAVVPPKPKVAEKKLTAPSVVEDPRKALEEKKLKEKAEAEKKRKLAEKAKLKKKRAAEEKKRKEELAKKKAAEAKRRREAAKKKKEQDREDRNRRLADVIGKIRKKRYTGESANVGGEGFGAARLGGKGMGGGTLADAEFLAYRNQLEQHIRRGWRWLPGGKIQSAQVIVQILPDGAIKNARIVRSSGNSKFDDSVTRAVFKASPVPPPPTRLYDRFREVRFTFDSRQAKGL